MKKTITLLTMLFFIGWTGISNLYGQAVLYGTIGSGGPANAGVLFEWNPATTTYTIRYDFNNSADGRSPGSSLVLYDGKIYGTAGSGGTSNAGVIFEYDPTSNTYTKKYDFDGTLGKVPFGILTFYNGKFYGTTGSGGTYNYGVIFEWDPTTNIYTKKYDFDLTNGGNPCGYLTLYDGKLYGMTHYGGVDYGVIFEWDLTTNTYTKKYDFVDTWDETGKGYAPQGALTLYDGKLYGGAQGGGTSDNGVIFEYDPSSDIYTKKHDFGGTNGSWPSGFLTLSGGKLYGTAQSDGSNYWGVIFEWDPLTNIYTKKYDFDGTNGSNAFSGLTLSDGKFYSMTSQGGATGLGVFFEWDPAANIYTKEFDLSTSVGYLPSGSFLLEYDPTAGEDVDGDGFTIEDGDCDDNDASINPGATEVCNGVDDNCDGQIDEGVGTNFYADADGDGFGDLNSTILACSQPEGYVSNSDDCDDNDASVNPGAEEICDNNIDDNCNGEIDEGCCDITVDAGDDVTTYFGLVSMQQVTRTALVSGGTPPYSYSWSLGRPLLCNQENEDGDESFYGGTCTDNICPESGSPAEDASCSGDATINAILIDTTEICVTVTDMNGCTATDCFMVNASDVRCVSGNGNVKVKVCHHTNSQNHPWVEMCVDTNALAAHLAHGDYLGSCETDKSTKFENESSDFDFALYPNPARNQLTVEFNSDKQIQYTVEITDMTGRKITGYSEETHPGINSGVMDLKQINRGIYLVTITMDGNRWMKKLIRQ